MTPNNYVATAALRSDALILSMRRPARHHTILQHHRIIGMPFVEMAEQGFLLSDGTFVSREEALKVALNAGQLTMANKVGNRNILFSEDLW